MLVIRRDLVDAMVAHARRDHPDEACGVIAGPAGSGRPERHVPMANAERSPTFYRFDSAEQLVQMLARKGVGRALIEAAEAWGRGQGCSEFGSDAAIDNETSIAAHRALGFAEVSRAVCFRKPLRF